MTRHTGPTSKFGFCEDAGKAVSKITANGMANRIFLISSPLLFVVEWPEGRPGGPEPNGTGASILSRDGGCQHRRLLVSRCLCLAVAAVIRYYFGVFSSYA